MSKPNLIFVIFDGIENSVFEGQVLQPIVNYYAHTHKVLLVSFEKNLNNINLIEKIENSHPDISLQILKRFPYLGQFSLFFNIYYLKTILKKLDNYQIIARGPFAGLVAIRAADNNFCKKITVQARGLLPEEYVHTNITTNIFKKIWHKFREKNLQNLEKTVYKKLNNIKFEIEAVSSALKDYLINNYNCDSDIVKIAESDIPSIFPANVIQDWKSETKKLLEIEQTAIIYCYSGSAKSWQCPEAVIDFFKNKLKTEPDAYLLILTQEPITFSKLLEKSKVDAQKYIIKSVTHAEVYKYLSAADYGIIFREINVLNWISRPTKALEYEAVGLKIIHNNTVKWLIDKY